MFQRTALLTVLAVIVGCGRGSAARVAHTDEERPNVSANAAVVAVPATVKGLPFVKIGTEYIFIMVGPNAFAGTIKEDFGTGWVRIDIRRMGRESTVTQFVNLNVMAEIDERK